MKVVIEDIKKLGTVHEGHKWGYEIWIENTNDYCSKLLVLMNQIKGSLHYHKIKRETFIILEGTVQLRVGDSVLVLEKYDKVFVDRETRHQFQALSTTAVIMEISTHHEDSDSYKIDEGGQ